MTQRPHAGRRLLLNSALDLLHLRLRRGPDDIFHYRPRFVCPARGDEITGRLRNQQCPDSGQSRARVARLGYVRKTMPSPNPEVPSYITCSFFR